MLCLRVERVCRDRQVGPPTSIAVHGVHDSAHMRLLLVLAAAGARAAYGDESEPPIAEEAEVIVVGAGPNGLRTLAELRAQGINALGLEQDASYLRRLMFCAGSNLDVWQSQTRVNR